MDTPNVEYLDWQLSLFDGGHTHVMAVFTAHLTGSGNTVPIGIKLVDHPTGELIAYEVPILTGDLTKPEGIAGGITDTLTFVRSRLSPF